MISKKSFIFIIAIAVINLGATETTNPNQCFTPQEVTQCIHSEIEKASIAITKEIKEAINNAIQKMSVRISPSGITGVSVCVDSNIGFFYDRQNPSFDITYKSFDGITKIKRFYASIYSIGFKTALVLNLNLIFIVNTAFDFYEQNSIIKLGRGVDIAPGFGGIVYAPFKNMPGAIIMVQIPIGLNLAFSMVIGGKIKVVDFPLKTN